MANQKEDTIGKLKEWGFQPLMTALLALLTYYAAETNSEMKKMREDITLLTIQSSINKAEIDNLKTNKITHIPDQVESRQPKVTVFLSHFFKHEEEFDIKKYLRVVPAII